MQLIRMLDDRLGLLSVMVNEKTTHFRISLDDPDLVEYGFGLDDNGNYPAL